MEMGVVLTATELEGCAPAADWSRWMRRGRAPAPVGRLPFAESYPDDLEQLAGLGIDAIQLTLEWARLEPRQGHHDRDAIELRRGVLEATRRLGLTTWACLIDGTLPGWFADDEGGFCDERSRSVLWPRHVDWIGEHFGDLVDGWVPQREPIRWALRRHLWGTAPPGRRDPALAAEAVRAALLADGEAWRLLRGTAPVATYQTGVAIVPEPALAGGPNLKAGPHADRLERFLSSSWLTALNEGVVVVGDLRPREVDHLRGAFDRVVVELRPTIEVDSAGRARPRRPHPPAMAEVLRRTADELGGRAVVAAGDLGHVPDDGRARGDHVQAMLDLTAEAAGDGVAIGWWQSSPIDGYRWEPDETATPGLIDARRQESDAAAVFRRYGD